MFNSEFKTTFSFLKHLLLIFMIIFCAYNIHMCISIYHHTQLCITITSIAGYYLHISVYSICFHENFAIQVSELKILSLNKTEHKILVLCL